MNHKITFCIDHFVIFLFRHFSKANHRGSILLPNRLTKLWSNQTIIRALEGYSCRTHDFPCVPNPNKNNSWL